MTVKTPPQLEVDGRRIGPGEPPFIIAEISGNHMGSRSRALELVDAAARAGVDAVKLQTYTADSMTIDVREGEFVISDPDSPWAGRTLYDLYREASTPWAWHPVIRERCRELGITFFSTPFDVEAVEALDDLGVPMFKIASFENGDLPLIRAAAATQKPVIISLGMASLTETALAVSAARKAGAEQLALLRCASSYPARASQFNLATIPHLAGLFDVVVGLSDHTLGIGVAVAAVALGACIVEKHLTLSRQDGAVDSDFSLEPVELATLVREARHAWESVGEISYAVTAEELASRPLRRSLYVIRDVRAGDRVGPDNVRAIRPGLGLGPEHLDTVVGRRFASDAPRGTPLGWELIA